MTPSDRMLRQNATLVTPGEALDDDGVPRPNPQVIGTGIRCAAAPVTLATAAALRAESGASQIDGQLYFGPEVPRLAVGDTANINGFGVWTVSGKPREHAASNGQLGHRAYPAVQEV